MARTHALSLSLQSAPAPLIASFIEEARQDDAFAITYHRALPSYLRRRLVGAASLRHAYLAKFLYYATRKCKNAMTRRADGGQLPRRMGGRRKYFHFIIITKLAQSGRRHAPAPAVAHAIFKAGVALPWA